ncbi:phosphatidate cytidylyltransferase [Clostridium magnum]|uniref:Phosphatidate cytidylyltransferase n=1 Tax=Clostridium magnum DSM 2767 TaxID=1121326 RepID=A0A162V203_9CLOT|nr:phosphatidate cytidylyltransferase [Clostridium magnum]KZL94479.1 phosphatidate cytidylyltransferase [Clostridium magnum DSM 2767]SHI21859.1 phosphatidate cytidylyltransferase [Clostridium magnum DSM 2767]
MNNRYIGALIIAPFLILLFLGGVYLKYGVMILSLLGMHEFYKVIREKNINAISSAGYLLCLIYYITLSNDINYKLIFFILVITVFIIMCIPVLDINYNFIDISVTILVFLYVAIFFSFIVLVNSKVNGNYLVWIIFISSWLCDTAAYYAGRFFGKKKLCPAVSPKKTVEGSIGGILGSAIACGIFGFIINSKGIEIPIYHFLVIGIVCGGFCQFGDLAASSIKRHVGVKDYSNLIPGHGGILDRFDSILFASVVVYYYLTFVVGI